MDEDGNGESPRRPWRQLVLVAAGWVMAALAAAAAWDHYNLIPAGAADNAAPMALQSAAAGIAPQRTALRAIFTPGVCAATLALIAFSAFFSSCEVGFFSLNRLQLRSMGDSARALDRLAARLMEHPGNLLTSILMGNCIVNVLLGIVLAARMQQMFAESFGLDTIVSYMAAIVLGTSVLVLFGEITPKLIVVRRGQLFARYAALPIFAVDRALMPLRYGIITFVGFVFRVTRFSEVRPVPFMTDEEFLSLLTESEAAGAIEKDERQMIQGILEFTDATVQQILIPRPDMIALPETATVGEALALVREHEFARIPVYREHLDQIAGVLYAKDLLRSVDSGDFGQPIAPMLHKAHFVPETMRVSEFMNSAQRLRTHIAIVVDEYGGTEGLVTLHDALREVVGEICELDEDEELGYTMVQKGLYHVEGSLPLGELEALTGAHIDGGEHHTVAGFLMDQSEKILEAGDTIEHQGVRYTVEEVDGKRVSMVRIQVLSKKRQEKSA